MTTRYIQDLGTHMIDWGRHAKVNGMRGTGGAVMYVGEAAEVMRLVCNSMRKDKK